MLENLCVLLVRSFQRLKPVRHKYGDGDNAENGHLFISIWEF